jgi:hypothetical protein
MRKVQDFNIVKKSIRQLKNTGIYGDILCAVRDILLESSDPDFYMMTFNNSLKCHQLLGMARFMAYKDPNKIRSQIIRRLNVYSGH